MEANNEKESDNVENIVKQNNPRYYLVSLDY